MRIVMLFAALAILLVGCGQKGVPSAQSSDAGIIASAPPASQPSVQAEADRPVSPEDLGAIGYTDMKVMGDHEEWRTDREVHFPVLVIQDGKVTVAKAEDGTFECLLHLQSRPHLDPATAVEMYKAALVYKAGPPSTSTTRYHRGATEGFATCSYSSSL